MHTYEYKINPVVNYLLHFDYYITCDDILLDISNLLLSSHACNKFIYFFYSTVASRIQIYLQCKENSNSK